MSETVPLEREHYAVGIWDSVLDESEPGPLDLIRAQERASLVKALGISALSEADQTVMTEPWTTQIERYRGLVRSALAEGKVINLLAANQRYVQLVTADNRPSSKDEPLAMDVGTARMARLLHLAVRTPGRFFGEDAERADGGRDIFNMLHSLGVVGAGEPVGISAYTTPVNLRAAPGDRDYVYDPARNDTFMVAWVSAIDQAQHLDFAVPEINDYGTLPLVSAAIAPAPLDELSPDNWFLAGVDFPLVHQDSKAR